ncbi:B12-binding domain-containing radical SAM protein [Marinicella rhabdoformis]|uniref:B12-binding domain-containing radical SAM protein n=1 Tax=Marinicella rhabdoformis TaxID=2580566 RepID=UPI0012AEDA31|nr:DUF4080 domain-containing protein [Marinicella rhabdoformis]
MLPETTQSTDILLTTLNSKYIHSSFSLRYLYANLGEWQSRAAVIEFTIHDRATDMAEKLLAYQPKVIGFSVYIWNVVETTELVKLIKTIAPEIKVVLGGPEVSHLPDQPEVVDLADYVVQGAGEHSFKQLCGELLNNEVSDYSHINRHIKGIAKPLEELNMPYAYYSDDDIKNRIVYVEASRGCPFKCEFCLSSLDRTSKTFTLDRFLDEMDKMYQKGARNFKFIDRTFNLKMAHSSAILQFFLDRMDGKLTVHFEVIPDRLPEKLRQLLVKFPAQSLQFEIGVQTFDPEIQTLISRKQDNDKTKENLLWLRENTLAHIHADLIFGLPGDSLANFACSFDQLLALKPQEIQLGILKRLRGAPINRHTRDYQMRYNPAPPYTILSTATISFQDLQKVNRFARYWDMFGNSGRFSSTLPMLMADAPFERFMQFSETLYATEKSTWKISLRRQFVLLYRILTEHLGLDAEQIFEALQKDFDRSGEKGHLFAVLNRQKPDKGMRHNKRQAQHV